MAKLVRRTVGQYRHRAVRDVTAYAAFVALGGFEVPHTPHTSTTAPEKGSPSHLYDTWSGLVRQRQSTSTTPANPARQSSTSLTRLVREVGRLVPAAGVREASVLGVRAVSARVQPQPSVPVPGQRSTVNGQRSEKDSERRSKVKKVNGQKSVPDSA
eukprot:430116-Rhodomonas_salina.5